MEAFEHVLSSTAIYTHVCMYVNIHTSSLSIYISISISIQRERGLPANLSCFVVTADGSLWTRAELDRGDGPIPYICYICKYTHFLSLYLYIYIYICIYIYSERERGLPANLSCFVVTADGSFWTRAELDRGDGPVSHTCYISKCTYSLYIEKERQITCGRPTNLSCCFVVTENGSLWTRPQLDRGDGPVQYIPTYVCM